MVLWSDSQSEQREVQCCNLILGSRHMTAFQVFSFLSVAALFSQPTELPARVVFEMPGSVSEWCCRSHPSASQTGTVMLVVLYSVQMFSFKKWPKINQVLFAAKHKVLYMFTVDLEKGCVEIQTLRVPCWSFGKRWPPF